jgi:hypothetical protein
MPETAPPTQDSTPWYVRFQIVWLVGCVLLAQSLLAWYRPAPANYWQKSTQPDAAQQTNWWQPMGDWSTGPQSGYLSWSPDIAAGAQSLTVTMSASGKLQSSVLLQYTTEAEPYWDHDVIHVRTLRPARSVASENEILLTWLLPETAREIRLVLPAHSKGRFTSFKLRGMDSASATWNYIRQALQYTSLAVLVSLLVYWAWKHLGWLHWHPHLLGLLLVALHGLVMIFALPPFQGPDENRHWKTAVELFRRDGQAGMILYRLPVILDAESPRLRSEVPFSASLLQAQPDETGRMAEQIKVTYAKHWGYPTIGFVSLIYPMVTSVQEAVGFYYTCRLVNLCCLLILLGYAFRLRVSSWLLFTFCSLPLVMQQCIVLSTDTVHNLGTFWALLLAARMYKQPSSTGFILLCIVSVLVVMGKPPIYLLTLLLPAWFLPWRRILFSIWMIPGILLLIAGGFVGYWYLWRIVDGTGLQLGEAARLQLEFVLTTEGLHQFAAGAMEYPQRVLRPHYWFGPLGWLDTLISPVHVHLLWISLLLALIADVIQIGRWFYHAGVPQLSRLVFALIAAMLHASFIWWCLALVMYLTISPLQAQCITGMQVRYMIPSVFMFLLWPVIAARDWTTLPYTAPANWKRWLAMVMLVLAIIRCWHLLMDLIQRYWRS